MDVFHEENEWPFVGESLGEVDPRALQAIAYGEGMQVTGDVEAQCETEDLARAES